jgi:hypothetical protein
MIGPVLAALVQWSLAHPGAVLFLAILPILWAALRSAFRR